MMKNSEKKGVSQDLRPLNDFYYRISLLSFHFKYMYKRFRMDKMPEARVSY